MERKFAHSDRLALPRITAPASRNLVTRKASPASASASAGEPAVAGSPVTAMLSLTSTGMPVQRPGRRAARAGLVAGPGVGGRLRADADDRVQHRVEPLDPAQVESCQFRGGEGAGGEGLAQRRDRARVGIESRPAERLATCDVTWGGMIGSDMLGG